MARWIPTDESQHSINLGEGPQMHKAAPPTQSDALSAEQQSSEVLNDARKWFADTDGYDNPATEEMFTYWEVVDWLTRYAALRTARADEQLKLTRVELKQSCEERERLLATERAKVAQLERERALEESAKKGYELLLSECQKELRGAESALSEARDRAIKEITALVVNARSYFPEPLTHRDDDVLETFMRGLTKDLRKLLAGASGAAGKGGADEL